MPALAESIPGHALAHLGAITFPWAATALLPLPALLAGDPASCCDVACVYLGVACAWLASEIIRRDSDAQPTRSAWLAKILAITIAVESNVAIFILLGLCVGVKSHIPFPLLAVLSSIPALGLVPFLTQHMSNRYAALLAAALIVLACKLTGCVVARFTYGPHYMEQGYVDADWRNAKLMISLFWMLSTGISLTLLAAGWWRAKATLKISAATLSHR